MFYDPSGQVNKIISDITGAQSDLRSLGPAEDITPTMENVANIGTALDDLQRIRQLEDARVAAEASGDVPSASNPMLETWRQDLIRLSGELGTALSPGSEVSNPEYINDLRQAIRDVENRIRDAENAVLNSGDKVSIIDAQMAAIRARLPRDAEGNYMSEELLRTELARENEKIARNDRRIGLTQQVSNLAKIGVPKLNGPIRPVVPAA